MIEGSMAWLVTTIFLLILWVFIGLTSVYVTYRTTMYGMLIIAGGVLPKVIFYVYVLAGVWTTTNPNALLYARIGDVSLGLSIFLSMQLMYKSVKIQKLNAKLVDDEQ